MRLNVLASTLFLLLLLASCYSTQPEEKNAYVFKQFPEEKNAPADNYMKVNNIAADGMLLFRDSLLFIRSAANTSPFHFSLFNLKTKSLLQPCLPASRKTGGSLAFLSYGISNGYLWVHDIVKDKIIAGNIDSLLNNKDYVFREIAVPTFYYSLQLMDNNKEMIGFGDYDSDYKLSIVDLSNGKMEQQLLPYAADSSHPVSRGEKMEYESFLFLKPGTNDRSVLACRYTDRIEVTDLHTRQSKIIKGPENYPPRLTIAIGGDQKELSTRNSETRYAFVKGKVTDKYIYLLYSGNNHESKFLNYGRYIYVYDWNGNPIKKLTCDDYVIDFAVTGNDKLLYTYNPKSKSLQVSSL